MNQASAPPNSPHVTPSRGRLEATWATWKPAIIAAVAGLAALAGGVVVEEAIIRAVHGSRNRLEWISDVVISAAVVGLTYLWLHLKNAQTRVRALEREQIVIDEQLRLAAEIQRGLLPDVPKTTPGFRWAARMVPAGRIGGDFYDFLRPADGTVLAILGDVSGKGIPAALILSSLKTLFHTTAHETVDPAAIAERVSDALYEEYAGQPYATAIVARFQASPARISYVNAGHPSGFLLRHGSVNAAFESGGLPLGLFSGTKYARVDVELRPGDIGVLVTDGVTEALETGPLTLDLALGAALLASGSPADICGEVLQAAAGGRGPAGVTGWEDDRTVLVFAAEPGVGRLGTR